MELNETEKEEYTFRKYFNDISHYKLIKDKTKLEELSAKSRGGDIDARNELIEGNLRLVVKIAHDYRGKGLTLEELVSEGNLGLIRAAELYDSDKARFSSYAGLWIRQAMRTAVKENTVIRVPASSKTKVAKFLRAKADLAEELGREPTMEEMSKKQGIKYKKAVDFNEARHALSPASMSQPLVEDDCEATLGDFVSYRDEDMAYTVMDHKMLLTFIDKHMSEGDQRDKEVLLARFGFNDPECEGWTLEECAEAFGLTRERIRQIQNRALKRIRYYLKRHDEYNPN